MDLLDQLVFRPLITLLSNLVFGSRDGPLVINLANLMNGQLVHAIGLSNPVNLLWNFIFLVVGQSVAMHLSQLAMLASLGLISLA